MRVSLVSEVGIVNFVKDSLHAVSLGSNSIQFLS